MVVDREDKTESDVVHDDLWSLDLTTFAVRDFYSYELNSSDSLLQHHACGSGACLGQRSLIAAFTSSEGCPLAPVWYLIKSSTACERYV